MISFTYGFHMFISHSHIVDSFSPPCVYWFCSATLYSVVEINPELQLIGFNETNEKLTDFVGNQIILCLWL